MKRVILLAIVSSLAACSGDADDRVAGDELEAKGEILGGTISDDMLPLESRSSQSPPLAGEEERLQQLADEQSGQATTAPEPAPAAAELSAESDEPEPGEG